ncbi:YrhB domain-containing protein [Streptomyces niveus]|uniref:YrhB domain-containing protein n=1 Tax=Streptomyces niveus TaxID=193462 RepID=UPI0037A08E96
MSSKKAAVQSAAEFLKSLDPDKWPSRVMLPDRSEEYPYGWAVRYDNKEHIETGDHALKPFTAVVIVPHDGSAAHFPPSHLRVSEYMALRATGDWPPARH